MKSYKSYKFSDSEYNGTTITNMIEHYWSNISNQTYGIASFLNSSNAFSGTYYKHDNNNGFIIFSGQSPSYKTQKGIMMNGNWTWTSLVTNTDLSTYYSMDNAIEIPKNADLNNYHQFGNYISIAASTTDTLKNCPLTGSGFAMHVERITGDRSDYCKQRIISNNSNAREYWRTKLEGVWQKWYMVVGEQVN